MSRHSLVVAAVTEGVSSNLVVYETLVHISVTVPFRHLALPNAVAFLPALSVWRASCFKWSAAKLISTIVSYNLDQTLRTLLFLIDHCLSPSCASF